jgi:hypothetical protein
LFDEKQLEEYRGITAPQSLKVRVMSAERKPAEIISFPRKALTVAASVAVAFIGVLAFGGNSTEVSLDYASPAAISRNTQSSVVLNIEADRKSVISVSGGMLKSAYSDMTAAQIEISDDTRLEWLVDYSEDYILTVNSGFNTDRYSLGFNEHSEMWEFEKIK